MRLSILILLFTLCAAHAQAATLICHSPSGFRYESLGSNTGIAPPQGENNGSTAWYHKKRLLQRLHNAPGRRPKGSQVLTVVWHHRTHKVLKRHSDGSVGTTTYRIAVSLKRKDGKRLLGRRAWRVVLTCTNTVAYVPRVRPRPLPTR